MTVLLPPVFFVIFIALVLAVLLGGSQQFGSAKLAAVVALDRLLMLPALLHSRPSSSSTAASAFA
jgi:hypothetical protein